MHIEFKYVTLHNFMSFGDSTLHFQDDGFVRVSGINEHVEDNARSNGSGKSSLWEAIVWALTGDTIRGTKQVVNMKGIDGCYVELEFFVDTTKYKIIRSKDHKVYKTNLQIYKNDTDVSGKGIRDGEKLLEQYLPDITPSLLGSVIILGQGLPQKFTNNSPSGRKEVLEKLSKSDFMIADLKDRVSSRKDQLSSDLRVVEDSTLKLLTEKDLLVKQSQDSEQILLSLDETNIREQLDHKNSEKEELLARLADITKEYEDLKLKISDVKEKQNFIHVSEEDAVLSEKGRFSLFIQPHKETLSELQARLNVLKGELTRIRSIKDVCPTCGQKLSDVHKPDTTDLENDITDLSNQYEEKRSYISTSEKDHLTKIAEIYDTYKAEKESLSSTYKQLSLTYSNSGTEINNLNVSIQKINDDIDNLSNNLSNLQHTIQFNKKIIEDNSSKLTVIEDKILYNNMQKDLTQSHLDIISKFDTALKRDFRGYLLSTVIENIQARAKQYSRVIFDTEDIVFCLDGNNIDISYMSKAYENLSGGEKQKIDLIIQFSIRDMLASQLDFTSNLLVLDEVFDALDAIGCNRVIDMISNLSDVKNVFIVTHRKDLSIPNDKELTVVKSTVGISEIK